MIKARFAAVWILVAAMALSITGCQSGTPGSVSGSFEAVSSGVPVPHETDEPIQDPAEPDPDPAGLEDDTRETGPVRLLLTYDPTLGSTEEGRERVASAFSDLVRRETELETEITWTTAREASTLLAVSGESFDLFAGDGNAASLDAQGLFSLIKASRIETYAPGFSVFYGTIHPPPLDG